MFQKDPYGAVSTRLLNRFAARMTGYSAAPTAFVSSPEPRTIGLYSRGKQLLAGNYLFAGQLLSGPRATFWDLPASPEFRAEAQGCGWLDDLAALGDPPAREAAQTWVWQWLARFGRGTGPGWTPDLTGRRLIRWINHGFFLLQHRDKAEADLFFRSLAHQTRFLARRWHAARPGLARFEALSGLLHAALSLEGMEALIGPAEAALCRECTRQIDATGGLPTRNPEELLEVFMLLSWSALALRETGRQVAPAHEAALLRIAPVLRSLRHADGALARFQGGGRGVEGRLEQALAASGVRAGVPQGLSMGYARLSGGRSTLIIDAALPPQGRTSHNAHASTLAFELTSGRRPVIVNCGSGACFGADWRRAGRATPSHSTLCIEGISSSRLGHTARDGTELMSSGPSHVPVEIGPISTGQRFEGGHNGWQRTHGLTHARRLELASDGRELAGEDMLFAVTQSDKALFDKALARAVDAGLLFQIRFHLHPEVEATMDLGGTAVSLGLRSGEIWVLRSEANAEISLEPSVYLETGRLKPRATKQVVLSARAMEYATRIRWSLAKAHDSAIALRDTKRDEIDLS